MSYNYEAKNGKLFLNNSEISLRGINHFGLEGGCHSIHALWAQPLDNYVNVLKTNGFNAVRLTISAELMLNLDTYTVNSASDSMNPGVNGSSAGKQLDLYVKKLGDAGILVMFNMHNLLDNGPIDPLWYTASFPESKLTQAFVTLAQRYKNSPNVFAMDIINEPHGSASWGGDPSTDWASAAERIGNEILKVNSNLLICVEAITDRVWADDCSHVQGRPINLSIPNKYFVSPHEYKDWVYKQQGDSTVYWDSHFGNVFKSGFPLVVGEYGYSHLDPLDTTWANDLANYLNKIGLQNAFYWCLNQNGNGSQWLLEADWATVVPSKMDIIKKITPNPTHFNFSSTPSPPQPQPNPTPSPTPAPAPQPSPAPGPSSSALSFTVAQQSSWKSGNDTIYQQVVTVTNTGKTTVKNATINITNTKVTSFYSLTQNGNSFSFPSWLVSNGGLMPSQNFQFGVTTANVKANITIS